MTQKLIMSLFAVIIIGVFSGCDKSDGEKTGDALPQTKSDSASASVIDEETYRRHVATLASDEFGGRRPNSKGEELTVDYLVSTFKSLGLSPGNGDSYIQKVPLISVEVTNRPALTINDNKGNTLVLEYGKEQVVSTRRQIPDSELLNSEVVFVGYGINAPERNWNDYANVDVKGKTVIVLINDPGFATQNPNLFNGNSMTYYGRWTYKYDEAARQGATGVIIIHDTKPAAYPWATVENSWIGPQFDIRRRDQGKDLAAVESWINKEKATALFEMAGIDLTAMYQRAQTPGFEAVEMNLTASTSLKTQTNEVVSKNVAALIKGSEKPEEIFVYMAHWDHLGIDASAAGDGIFNGAFDNATGTSGLLELAAAFSNLKSSPRRSVLFLAVTAEEQGLLGSHYYAANPLFPLQNTVAGLNMDGLNNIGATHDVTVIGYGFSQLDGVAEIEANKQGRVLAADREAEKGKYFRSDHFELAKLGVPMMYLKGGYDHKENGLDYGLMKSAEYTANHYHRVSDEYHADWNVSGALDDLQLYFQIGTAISNGSDWPNWNDGSEFKALRDAQRTPH